MEHFDLLFTRVNDIGEVQQQMKTQMDIRGQAMDNYTAEQQLIAQQVKANGAAVAQLTMRQFDNDGPFSDDSFFFFSRKRRRTALYCINKIIKGG